MKFQVAIIIFLLSFTFAKGQIKLTSNDLKDVRDGVWYTVHPPIIKPLNSKDSTYFCEKTFDGIITQEGYKTNGMLNGEIRMYEQGKLINIFQYKNDVPEGEYWAFFFPSEKAYILGQFKDGKKDGKWFELNLDGKVINVKEYKDDVQIK